MLINSNKRLVVLPTVPVCVWLTIRNVREGNFHIPFSGYRHRERVVRKVHYSYNWRRAIVRASLISVKFFIIKFETFRMSLIHIATTHYTTIPKSYRAFVLFATTNSKSPSDSKVFKRDAIVRKCI